MPTALYISYDGMTDPLGQSQVIPYLKELSNAGFKIILISFEKESRKHEQTAIRNDINSYDIIWKPLKYHKRPILPATLLDILIGTYFAFFYCKKYKAAIIHCRSYIAALITCLIKPFFRFKIIFDMRGFWADERVEGGIWNRSNFIHGWIYRLFKLLEKKFFEQSDQVISLTETAKRFIEKNFKLKREIVVIPCSTDLALFSSHVVSLQDPEIQKAREGGKVILIYVGSIGTWYLLGRMLQFFKVLNEMASAVFLIVTPDSKEVIIEEAKNAEINLSDIIIRKSNRNDMPKWLGAADAGIFFIKPVFSKIASSPVKHGEMMACGLPVVTNTGIGDLDEIISITSTGVIVNDWKPETMREAAKRLLKFIEEKDTSRYQNAVEAYYSLENASAKYIRIYSNLLNEQIAHS